MPQEGQATPCTPEYMLLKLFLCLPLLFHSPSVTSPLSFPPPLLSSLLLKIEMMAIKQEEAQPTPNLLPTCPAGATKEELSQNLLGNKFTYSRMDSWTQESVPKLSCCDRLPAALG